MLWEVGDLAPGTIVHVDDQPYQVFKVRQRLGLCICPPYVGLIGETAPTVPLDMMTHEAHGAMVSVWWVSYLRVQMDALPLEDGVTYPGTAMARR
jgi:hypothetical protein